jgi:hypothetical protein
MLSETRRHSRVQAWLTGSHLRLEDYRYLVEVIGRADVV